MKKIDFKELEKIAKENASKAENDTYQQFLQEEAEREIWENLSLPEKLIKIDEGPFSSEKEILEEMNEYYSIKNFCEGDSLFHGHLTWLRTFLITGRLYYNNEWIEKQKKQSDLF